jgi:hypothetical protein
MIFRWWFDAQTVRATALRIEVSMAARQDSRSFINLHGYPIGVVRLVGR